jgi:hypothetical protein
VKTCLPEIVDHSGGDHIEIKIESKTFGSLTYQYPEEEDAKAELILSNNNKILFNTDSNCLMIKNAT